MSTDRGWTSCMDLYDGSNSHYVQYDIEEGTFVAYAIRGDDLNIENPIGRVLIKPYVNLDDMDDVLYVPEETVYGENIGNFREKVVEVLEKIQGEKIGTFRLKGKLYCDSRRTIENHPKVIQDMIDGKTTPETKEDVEDIIDALGIKLYAIGDNLVVDTLRDVSISDMGLKVIPIQFGIVKGDFDCSENNLTSLEGAPKEVGGDFWCYDNDVQFTMIDVRRVSLVNGDIEL